ncbi:hypothetical protein DIPPA_18430 [Diplonema papillatum]|nr:hypothetical protein DIPPA_18430 [Diplonema papillatum]
MNEAQSDELDGLQSLFGDDIQIIPTSPAKVEVKMEGTVLYLTMPPGYPDEDVLQIALGHSGNKAKKMLGQLKETAGLNQGSSCAMVVIETLASLLAEEKEYQTKKEAYNSDDSDHGKRPEGSYGAWVVTEGPGWIKIAIDVKPGKPQTVITNPTDLRRAKAETIEVDVAAPARLGAANSELFKFLSRKLKVNKDNIEFASSRKTKNKCLKLSGITSAEVFERINS